MALALGWLVAAERLRWRRLAWVGVCLLAWGARDAAAQTPVPCGPADGVLILQRPVAGLCATGNASAVTGNGPWVWTCAPATGPAPNPPVYCVAPTTIGATPIPDSRFSSYVKFFGDESNDGTLATQARVNAVVTRSEQPFFLAGFFRPEDHPTWGMLAAVQSRNRNDGIFALSLGFDYSWAASLFEWRDGPYFGLARAPAPIRGRNRGGVPASHTLNQWEFIAAVIQDHCHSLIFLEGLWSDAKTECVTWPSDLSSTTFGSYYDVTQRSDDAHVFNGGLRDWAVVTGTPSAGELMRMRDGEDPRAIWGAARVWGYWNFTANPAMGGEPDLTGHGHNLSYIGGGSVDPKKPVLIVRAAKSAP